MNNTLKNKQIGRPKSQAKRQQILDGATELFLAKGYTHTSMDAIAKSSGVSKQTVYSHFNSKEDLYTAIIENKCQEYQIDDASVCVNKPLGAVLTSIAVKFLQLMQDENVIAMYKLVIGEASKNNRVAQIFHEAGPRHGVKVLARVFAVHESTLFSQDKAEEAALDFFNLLKTDFHMASILDLPYKLSQAEQQALGEKVAHKIMLLFPSKAPNIS
jgi:TetR/AcrR family transcriptional repressor of mexJK operon